MSWQDALTVRHACREAMAYAAGFETFEAAWAACERGDWLLWWMAKTADRKRVVGLACQCARLALPHVRAGGNRPRIAIETAEKWCRGEASIEDVGVAAANAAAYAAYAAYAANAAAYAAADAASAAYAAANAAAYAAAYAAYVAANAATYAANAAADAAYAAAYAANAATADAYAAADAAAARQQTLKQCADIVRAEFPTPPL